MIPSPREKKHNSILQKEWPYSTTVTNGLDQACVVDGAVVIQCTVFLQKR